MDDEQQLYHQTSAFVQFLSSWSSNESTLDRRIKQLARDIARNQFWQWKEVEIIDAWIDDLHSVGYKFPKIIQQKSISQTNKIKRRTAVCVTGLAECIQEGWTLTYNSLRNRLQGDIDTFLFLSSTSPSKQPIPPSTRFKQIRSYMNSTVTILYEDRAISPNIPSNCMTYYYPAIDKSFEPGYFQQIWALSECLDLVKTYEQKFNIQYELFIRARIDSVLSEFPFKIEPPDKSTIVIPDEHHFNGYNDRFAIGSIDLMEKYMRRWHGLRECIIRNIHAESYLKLFLDQFNIKVELMRNLSYIQVPHGNNQCH